MKFTSTDVFKEYENAVLNAIKTKSNLLVVTVPGLGETRFIREFIGKNKSIKAKIINTPGESLTDVNFLDLDLDNNKGVITTIDEYFKKANPHQKFIVNINDPSFLEDENFLNSYVCRHVYNHYYFRVNNNKENEVFSLLINPNLTNVQLSKICDWSGGIARIMKHLAVNSTLLNKGLQELLQNTSFINLINPTIDVIARCGDLVLENLGIKREGKYTSEVVAYLMEKRQRPTLLNIKINPDLSFSEDGILSEKKLLLLEKQILAFAIGNRGLIEKEKVAEIKWGEGSYDEYSDQAIGKTIQRLKKKLNKYTFEVLPQIGYKLVKK